MLNIELICRVSRAPRAHVLANFDFAVISLTQVLAASAVPRVRVKS